MDSLAPQPAPTLAPVTLTSSYPGCRGDAAVRLTPDGPTGRLAIEFGAITYSYQWLSCSLAGAQCRPIDSAAEQTYVPGRSDRGHGLAVTVTARVGSVAASATCAPTLPVAR